MLPRIKVSAKHCTPRHQTGGRTCSSSAAGVPVAPRRTRAWAAAAANAATASATLRKYVSSCAGSVAGESTFRRMRSSRRVELWISCDRGKKAQCERRVVT